MKIGIAMKRYSNTIIIHTVLLSILDNHCKEIIVDTHSKYWTTSHNCASKWQRLDKEWTACEMADNYEPCILRTSYLRNIPKAESLFIFVKTASGVCSPNQKTSGELSVSIHFKRDPIQPRVFIKPIHFTFLCPGSSPKPLEILGPWRLGIYIEFDVKGSCRIEEFKVFYHLCKPPDVQLARYPLEYAPSSTGAIKNMTGMCVENAISSSVPTMQCYKNGSIYTVGKCYCEDKYFKYGDKCKGVDVVQRIIYSNFSDGSVVLVWRPPSTNPNGYFTYLVSINNKTKRTHIPKLTFESSHKEPKHLTIKVIAELHVENKTYSSEATTTQVIVHQEIFNKGQRLSGIHSLPIISITLLWTILTLYLF